LRKQLPIERTVLRMRTPMSISRRDSLLERALLFQPEQPDPVGVADVLDRADLAYHVCATEEALEEAIIAGAGTAVITEEALTQTFMQRLVHALQRQPSWSDFPLVVLLGQVGRDPATHLHMLELLEPLGNVTVLQRPVAALALVRAVRAALRARRRQYLVRDLLDDRDSSLRQRDQFLSLLAHELRNPLGVIRNAAYILERVNASAALAQEQRSTIVRQTGRLSRLIDETLDYFQVMAGKARLRRKTVELGELVGRCLQAATPEAQTRSQQLGYRGPDRRLAVEGDPQRLERAVAHLLAHAMMATPNGGRVAVELDADGDRATLRVRDGGPGLSTEELAGLFAPQLGVDRPIEKCPQLGLVLAAGMIAQHGGSVMACLFAPGLGTEIVTRLPLTPAVAPEPAVPADPRPTTGARHVLVVEDNDDGRETLKLLLQLWGHQVDVAADGLQGVQKALAKRPEVGLIDIGLPGLDGYQVAERLRAALGHDIVLVAMTGYGQPHDRQRALDAGFDVHLVKPLAPSVLQNLLTGRVSTAADGHPR